MRTTKQLLGAVSAVALVAMSSSPAFAAGTNAGTTITNNVSVDYTVNGNAQTRVTASNAFTVDRRVNLTVTAINTPVQVSPNQTNRVLAFDVTNSSNSAIDVNLATALRGGTATNITNIRIFRDSNSNRQLDADELTAGPITFLDEVAADATVGVLVVSNIGIGARNGDTFTVGLTGTAHAAGATGLGTLLQATSGANDPTAIDTVLFDGASAGGDAANNGQFSANGVYTVSGAVLTLTKTSRVLADPVNDFVNGTDPNPNAKAIPGATVEYCITVANAAGAATASGVTVNDDLPPEVTFVTGSSRINGTATCTGGTAGGTLTPGGGANGRDLLSGTLSDVAAGETRSMFFRVVIR